jgi:hypothetical protein
VYCTNPGLRKIKRPNPEGVPQNPPSFVEPLQGTASIGVREYKKPKHPEIPETFPRRIKKVREFRLQAVFSINEKPRESRTPELYFQQAAGVTLYFLLRIRLQLGT